MEPSALFESHAVKALHAVERTFRERGAAYSDTWRECQWLTAKAVCRELGVTVPPEFLDAIACAAYIDMKFQRMAGGFKEDHLTDGIAYMAYLITRMQELKPNQP